MQPRHLVERVGPGSLLIVPGDRTDVIHATVAAVRDSREQTDRRGIFRVGRRRGFGRPPTDPSRTEMAGMVLTGGFRPSRRDLEAIRQAETFAYLVEEDTYAAASEVHDLLVKIHPADREKIELTKRLVAEHLDVDRILERFSAPGRVRRLAALDGDGRSGRRGFLRRLATGVRSLGGGDGGG